jgi:hypothetical protein
MPLSDQIICKPTPWFNFRALAMLAMFGTFSVLFFIDGTTGYRKKNYEYFLHAAFQEASKIFSQKNSESSLTKEDWKNYASSQYVSFPADTSILPADLKLPMKWPDVLADFDRMKSLQPHLIWQDYTAQHKLNNSVEEKPFDAGKINEQFLVFYICAALSVVATFILVRTSRRSLIADNHAFTSSNGRRIPYSEMKTLDLRKWDTKGIAFIDYETPSGNKRARIDGLTYGGFKKEKDQPAETLIQKIRQNFSGEIIEYTIATPETTEQTQPTVPQQPQ